MKTIVFLWLFLLSAWAVHDFMANRELLDIINMHTESISDLAQGLKANTISIRILGQVGEMNDADNRNRPRP